MADSRPNSDGTPSLGPREVIGLLLLVTAVGLLVSLAAWSFLQLIYGVQHVVFTTLPRDLGYHHGAPMWWYLVVLGVAGVIIALAVVRLPGEGGEIPAKGLQVGGRPAEPVELPGIALAGLATIGLGLVLGPETPLVALGAGLGILAVRSARRDTPAQIETLIAATGSFAAMSMVFSSPIITAVILVEALGLDRERLPLLLLPGLLAAGIGTLVSTGMASVTGLSTSNYSLGPLPVPSLAQLTLPDLGWTVLLAVAVAGLSFGALRLGLQTSRHAQRRPFLLIPAAGLAVAGMAIAFHAASGHGATEVLFSGEEALPRLVSGAGAWSISALLFLLAFKGLAWGISLGSFRGGPTFPALFIGATAGILASHLPGFDTAAAVGVGMAAGIVSVLRLPLAAVVLASLLTAKAGPAGEPLIIVGVVVAYLVTVGLNIAFGPEPDTEPQQGGGSPTTEPTPA